jgi:hypothetical protein
MRGGCFIILQTPSAMWSQQRWKKWSDLRDTCFGRCANQELDRRRQVITEYQQQVDADSMSKREAQRTPGKCEHECGTKFSARTETPEEYKKRLKRERKVLKKTTWLSQRKRVREMKWSMKERIYISKVKLNVKCI